MSSFKQVFIDAKELLVKYGWRQGSFGNCEMGFCASGAIRHAVIHSPEYNPGDATLPGARLSVFYAREAFRERVLGFDSIPGWNDEPGRTKEEVLAAFDKVIAAEE